MHFGFFEYSGKFNVLIYVILHVGSAPKVVMRLVIRKKHAIKKSKRARKEALGNAHRTHNPPPAGAKYQAHRNPHMQDEASKLT